MEPVLMTFCPLIIKLTCADCPFIPINIEMQIFMSNTWICLKVCPEANNNLELQNSASFLNVSSDETAFRAELLWGKLNLRLEICLFKPFWIGLEYVTLQPDIRLNFSLKSSNFNNCQQELSIVITFWTIKWIFTGFCGLLTELTCREC